MKQLTFLVMFVLTHLANAQTPELVPDYTGKTNYLAPKGWAIDAQQNGANYIWMAVQNNTAQSPVIASIILPIQNGQLNNLLTATLAETFSDLQAYSSTTTNDNDFHVLLSGIRAGQVNQIAAFIVRDPGKFLFINFFAATPTLFDQLGRGGLLYDCMQQQNPHDYGSMANNSFYNVYDPQSDMINGQYNMQSFQLQDYILQNSKPVTQQDLVGQWMQAVSYSTGNDYQAVVSGNIKYGENGYAHLLDLNHNGTYKLTYYYKNVAYGTENTCQMVENGTFTIQNNQLILKRTRYSGDFVVYGKRTEEDKSNLPGRTFDIGLLSDKKHLALKGPEFEYSISSDFGTLRLGFTKVK